MSIDTVMDEMQPVVFENEKFDFKKQSKTSAFDGHFGR